MSEMCRCSWDEVYEMPIRQFLNLLCYRSDKINYEKEQTERWRKTH